ncbi:MAG: hypothetical protein WAM04_22270 [Candidatus Sulfotelmatobacter sp.]
MPTREELEDEFGELGIDFANPGFCDTPAFQGAERQNPRLLIKYAQYINTLILTPEYLERSRGVVRDTADFLYGELVADGRRGACIDISGTLLRFLERQGIWAYFVGGGLRVQFPARSGIGTRWFWPLMHGENPALMGHAWVCAPPFKVIDLSFSTQPYQAREQRYLNGYVLIEECEQPPEETTLTDLMEPEVRAELRAAFRRPPNMDDLPQVAPGLREFIADFPSCKTTKDQVRLKYIPVNISAPDLPLERMTNLQLRGRYPLQLYREFERARNPN